MKIAIASGKGGTGKTTLSVNLAVAVSRIDLERKVVLTDLDSEEPNSALFFKDELDEKERVNRIVPVWNEKDCTFCGLCSDVCAFGAVIRIPDHVLISPEMCHSCGACIGLCPTNSLSPSERQIGTIKSFVKGNLSLVSAMLDVGEMSGVSLIKRTKNFVAHNCPSDSIFIFDCPPGNSCPVVEAVKGADLVVLVTEPTPFGLHDLKIAVETMQAMHLDYVVLINKAIPGKDLVRAYCIENSIPLVGEVPESRAYAETIAKGNLLAEEHQEYYSNMLRIFSDILTHASKKE